MAKGKKNRRKHFRGGVTLFHDTFTGAGTVALPDHTPEIGGPWVTAEGSDLSVHDGNVYSVASGSNSYIATGVSDVFIEATLTRNHNCIVRWESVGNYYLIQPAGGTINQHYIIIYKLKGGVSVGSVNVGPVEWTNTAAGYVILTIQTFGSSIKARVTKIDDPATYVEAEFIESEFTSGNHGFRANFPTPLNCTEILCRTTDGTDL